LDIINLEICFPFFVQRWTFVLLLEVEQFHTSGKAFIYAAKDELAVKDMLAVRHDCEQAILVVRATNQV
jgi:hypothetical protein